MGFGDAFGPSPPPCPEVRLAEATDAMRGLCVHIEALIRSLNGTPSPALATPTANADLEQMVNAVVGIKGPVTASEIAEALAARLAPSTPASDAAGILAAVEQLTQTFDHRMRGLGQAFGSAGHSVIDNITVTETGLAQQSTLATLGTEATLASIKRGITDTDQRLEYDAKDRLIYAGKVPLGGLTSDTNWTIQKLTYTGSNLTIIQQRSGSWDNRAGLAW